MVTGVSVAGIMYKLHTHGEVLEVQYIHSFVHSFIRWKRINANDRSVCASASYLSFVTYPVRRRPLPSW